MIWTTLYKTFCKQFGQIKHHSSDNKNWSKRFIKTQSLWNQVKTPPTKRQINYSIIINNAIKNTIILMPQPSNLPFLISGPALGIGRGCDGLGPKRNNSKGGVHIAKLCLSGVCLANFIKRPKFWLLCCQIKDDGLICLVFWSF